MNAPTNLSICTRCDKHTEQNVYLHDGEERPRPPAWAWVKRHGTMHLLCAPCREKFDSLSKKEAWDLYMEIHHTQSLLRELEGRWNREMEKFCGDPGYRGTTYNAGTLRILRGKGGRDIIIRGDKV